MCHEIDQKHLVEKWKILKEKLESDPTTQHLLPEIQAMDAIIQPPPPQPH